jgi:hypothetical protein
MEFTNNIFEKSYNYLDSFIVSIKNSFYDVFIELDEEEYSDIEYLVDIVENKYPNDNLDITIEEDSKGPMSIHELSVVENGEKIKNTDEEVDEHNTAFILEIDKIDWSDPRNSAYYDPHDDCVESPSFLHNSYNSGGYGSNYNGGYDSH